MSVDTFLGLPMNIASYATLQHLLAAATGYTPGILTGFLEDVHIYENHLDQVMEQLSRKPFPLPELAFSERICLDHGLSLVSPRDIALLHYVSHPAITAPMAA